MLHKKVFFLFSFFLIFCLTVISGCKEKKEFAGWPDGADVFTGDDVYIHSDLDIYVDLSEPETGYASIFMVFTNKRNEFTFKGGSSEEFQFEDVKFYNHKGEEIVYGKAKNDYILKVDKYKKIIIQYRVKPGGEGRHGRQGYICDKFASVDGRIFLLPSLSKLVTNARVNFKVPEGWKVINPHRKEGDWYYPDNSGADLVYKNLLKSPMVFGPFDHENKTFGNTEVSVYSYSEWDKEHKETLNHNSLKIYEYFFETYGFDPGFPYIICWTPRSEDNKRIFGAVWSNGCSYEMPENTVRNWELLGHRIAHALNKYEPTGMKLNSKDDFWSIEGWPCDAEVTSTVYAGIGEEGKRLNLLYKRYLAIREDHSDYDLPLISEHEAGPDAREYIHYCKCPLVWRMLDFEMKEKTGKSLEDFMAYSYQKYGSFREPFPFRKELETFAGVSFDDFWDVMINEEGYVIPVWEEYVTEDMKKENSRSSNSPYLLKEEKSCREKLEKEGITFFPELIGEYMDSFPTEVQKLILEYERKRLELTEK